MENKTERRGRPKDISLDEQPRKFRYRYNNYDGTEDVWTYDLDDFPNGPISVESNVKRKEGGKFKEIL